MRSETQKQTLKDVVPGMDASVVLGLGTGMSGLTRCCYKEARRPSQCRRYAPSMAGMVKP